MAHHLLAHPEPVEGCFGCKCLGIGYQGLQSRLGPDPVERRKVVGQEGRMGGVTVGAEHVHWDGRQDATVKAPTVVLKAEAKEIR